MFFRIIINNKNLNVLIAFNKIYLNAKLNAVTQIQENFQNIERRKMVKIA